MLRDSKVIGFVATRDGERAKVFYRDTLGLAFVEDTPFAMVFEAGGTMIRVSKTDRLVIAPYTVLGWGVDDIATMVRTLTAKGVVFERFESLTQDALGIWLSPDGNQVAWFKDPDGNMLSIAQFVKG